MTKGENEQKLFYQRIIQDNVLLLRSIDKGPKEK